eukprot:GSChrysophyteH1.ASY1.ANO1.1287.1 assembled CDS
MSSSPILPEFQEIQLLKDEAIGLSYEKGISTMTFVAISGDTKFEQVAQDILMQFKKIVYPPQFPGVDSLFKIHKVEDNPAAFASSSATYTSICTSMYSAGYGEFIVQSGYETLDQSGPLHKLCRLNIVETTKDSEFAVIFSLSHAIADGRTYYELFKMLSPGSHVWAMNPQREPSFSENMRDQCGRKELEWMDTTGVMCMYTCAMMPALLGCGRKARCVAYEIDSDRLTAAKAAAVTASKGTDNEVEYVSTNDIVTSAFFNETSARIGMMGMDCRGRIDGISNDLAGNYVTALTLDADSFGTPAALRKTLSSQPYKCTTQPLPTCCRWMCGRDSSRFAMATNWASFMSNTLQILNCEAKCHLPMQPPADVQFDLMVPFLNGPGKMAVLCWTVSSDESGLHEALPVGDRISFRNMFPE